MRAAWYMALGLLAATLVGGCAHRNTALYNWGPFEDQVYAHFKNEPPDQQIQILEAHAQATQASGKMLPPGYRAHLGLLYAKVGRDGDFLVALQQEKQAFPESAPYVDSLLSRAVARKEAPRAEK